MKKKRSSLFLLNLDKPDASSGDDHDRQSEAQERPKPSPPAEKSSGLFVDLMRGLVIVLGLLVAASVALVALPQTTVDGMVNKLEARHAAAQPEKIALLYLGDELVDDRFTVRGVIRNISADQIEQVDASIRFYGHDGTLLETAIVRMDKASIAPGKIAQFELAHPNYKMEFGSYSADFKLRQGGVIAYKDLRAPR